MKNRMTDGEPYVANNSVDPPEVGFGILWNDQYSPYINPGNGIPPSPQVANEMEINITVPAGYIVMQPTGAPDPNSGFYVIHVYVNNKNQAGVQLPISLQVDAALTYNIVLYDDSTQQSPSVIKGTHIVPSGTYGSAAGHWFPGTEKKTIKFNINYSN